MSSYTARKEAIRSFKEQKTPRGVFAIRCATTGQTWVGSSRNLDATKNGTWFCLRNGTHRDTRLQAEWNSHGEEVFTYESLEIIDDDISPFAFPDILKEKRAYWIAQLDACQL